MAALEEAHLTFTEYGVLCFDRAKDALERREQHKIKTKTRREVAATLAGEEASKWELAGVAKQANSARTGQCSCGRSLLWSYRLLNVATGDVLEVGGYCLRRHLPALVENARGLKHFYKANICSECCRALAQSNRLCAKCAEGASFLQCPDCGKSFRAKSEKHLCCFDCWRRSQLASSNRQCPRCAGPIPRDKVWWNLCSDCFLKDRPKYAI